MVVKYKKDPEKFRSWCFDCRAQKVCSFRGPNVDFCSSFHLADPKLMEQFKQYDIFDVIKDT